MSWIIYFENVSEASNRQVLIAATALDRAALFFSPIPRCQIQLVIDS